MGESKMKIKTFIYTRLSNSVIAEPSTLDEKISEFMEQHIIDDVNTTITSLGNNIVIVTQITYIQGFDNGRYAEGLE